MNNNEWISNEALERIAYNVFDDIYKGKVSKKNPDSYTLNIKTLDELLVIYDALANLTKHIKRKPKPGSRLEHPKKNILKKIEALKEMLVQYDFIDESIDHLSLIKAKVKQRKTWTAKQYTKSIAINVENSLREIGTSNERIRGIKRFITHAIVVIEKNPNRYIEDIIELSSAFLHQ